MARKKKQVEVERTPQEQVQDQLQKDLGDRLDIFECSKMGFEKRLTLLLEDDKVKSNLDGLETESANTALMLAAKNGKLKCCELLIADGADVNKAGFKQLTAVHYAVRNDELAVTKYLVETAKADTSSEDEAGNTPLHDAARMGNLKCVEVLLAAGANLEHTNKAGSTAFQAACLNARGALIDILLRKQVNVNAVDAMGDTALHMAASAGLERIVIQLLNASCQTDVVNSDGKTASDLAQTESIKNLIQG
jgi:ankyrin repeat protein